MNKVILTTLTLLWMIVIFVMSGADDDASRNQSGTICRFLCENLVEGFEELPLEEQQNLEESLSFPVRKCAHFTEYAILGILLTLTAGAWFPGSIPARINNTHMSIPSAGISPVRRGGPFLAGVLYAVTDEIHQCFVPGRAGQIRDVLIDACGVFVGVIIINRLLRRTVKGSRGSDPAVS